MQVSHHGCLPARPRGLRGADGQTQTLTDRCPIGRGAGRAHGQTLTLTDRRLIGRGAGRAHGRGRRHRSAPGIQQSQAVHASLAAQLTECEMTITFWLLRREETSTLFLRRVK
jgi:hypothetical protein